MIGRVYREAITDAAEACFSFTGLHEEAYMIDVELSDGLSYDDALKKAINVEEKSHDFCTRASEMSRDLLAGITQAFRRVARRKADREQTLKSLLDAE